MYDLYVRIDECVTLICEERQTNIYVHLLPSGAARLYWVNTITINVTKPNRNQFAMLNVLTVCCWKREVEDGSTRFC